MRTGRLTLARPPRGWRIEGTGSLSPGASRLAFAVSRGRVWRLAVANAATGGMSLLPGSRIAAVWPSLAWTADGEWLVWNDRSWRPHASRVEPASAPVLVTRRPLRAGSLVALP